MKYYKLIFILASFTLATISCKNKTVFKIIDGKTYLNDIPSLIIGLRCSNALINEEATNELIQHLVLYKSYGVNTVGVFVMGSRYGDVKGYNEDASLNQLYMDRLARIIEANPALSNPGFVSTLVCGSTAVTVTPAKNSPSSCNCTVSS